MRFWVIEPLSLVCHFREWYVSWLSFSRVIDRNRKAHKLLVHARNIRGIAIKRLHKVAFCTHKTKRSVYFYGSILRGGRCLEIFTPPALSLWKRRQAKLSLCAESWKWRWLFRIDSTAIHCRRREAGGYWTIDHLGELATTLEKQRVCWDIPLAWELRSLQKRSFQWINFRW